MAPVKLTYFDARGLAEPIRQILAYGGIEFEDIRLPVSGLPAVLPQDIKSRCRWGQVPLAEFEGKSLTQSAAIARYFAKKAKLIPEDDYLAALCDEYSDTIRELMMAVFPVVMVQDATQKKAKLDEVTKTIKAKYLDVFESIVKKNDGKHLIGDSLTAADIGLAYFCEHFKLVLDVDFTDGYPNLRNLRDNVHNTPKIKAWIEKRPKTKM